MPLFDYLFLYSMLSNFSLVHLGMYLALCVFDAATTSYILLTEKEGRFITGSMLLSKIVYRHYNLLIYIEVFINLVRQSPDTWKKITRTGRVQEL